MSTFSFERPNILLIVTDQQSAFGTGCHGRTSVSTPAMDSIAAAGVRFARAYCTQPLCKPSRSSLLTGRSPQATGLLSNVGNRNRLTLRPHLGDVLGKAGYDCRYAGKWHLLDPSIPEADAGFQRLAGKGDAGVTQAVTAYLETRPGEPFLLVASYSNPHDICQWARSQKLPEGGIPSAGERECPELPPNHAPGSYEPGMLRAVRSAIPYVHPTADFREREWRQYLYAYDRLCEKVDREIGSILSALETSGLAEKTLVILTSDHGDGMAAHQWNQKSALYEECIRVPLIASWPGVIAPGSVQAGKLVSNGLDLMPTLAEVAGAPVDPSWPGRSLLPLFRGEADPPWRTGLTVQTRWPELKAAEGRALIAERHKYMVYSWGSHREQLFDLKEDPGEMTNLAKSSRYDAVLERFRADLERECHETGDHAFLPYLV